MVRKARFYDQLFRDILKQCAKIVSWRITQCILPTPYVVVHLEWCADLHESNLPHPTRSPTSAADSAHDGLSTLLLLGNCAWPDFQEGDAKDVEPQAAVSH
jgi:hypothetical protein